MSQHTRIGIFGAGLIGREHAKHSVAAKGIELVAIADPSENAQDTTDIYGVPLYENYQDLLDQVEVDAVVVALPNAMHADAAIAALKRGIPALVEKPLADTLEAAARIVDCSETTGTPVLVGHQRRYAADIAAAKRFIDDGGLGTIVSAGILSTWRKPEDYFDVEWRTQKGAGPVLINLIHDIDVIRHLVGEVQSVVSLGSNKARKFEVLDTVGAVLEFENGAIGTALASDAAASPWCWDLASGYGAYFPAPSRGGDVYFISGTTGSLSLPSLTLHRHEGENHWQQPIVQTTIPREEVHPYVSQLEHLGEIARGSAHPKISARDGYRTLAVTIAIDESAETGNRVTVKK